MLVVTSIARDDNVILKALAEGAQKNDVDFIMIGDVPSPKDFNLDGCRFYGLEAQAALPFSFAGICPTRHYARKNIGYLIALSESSEVIVETDDDNIPIAGFWDERVRAHAAPLVEKAGWLNVYRYFSDATIWPRGLPLAEIQKSPPALAPARKKVDCPIQQGLADENPDVDAIYRLVLPLPQYFKKDTEVILGAGSWSPFNSQNTSWWREAAPLMYLPSYCSFRMTDIWRSFVAQRIAWECEWGVLYHSSTMRQERNEHDLMRDFADEVPGYTHNAAIGKMLAELPLKSGVAHMHENMRMCYRALVAIEVVAQEELPLLEAWLQDLKSIS